MERNLRVAASCLFFLSARRSRPRLEGRMADNDDVIQKYFPPDAAAKILGYSPKTLERWRAEGKGPKFHKLPGGRIRYSKADLDAWMAQFRHELQAAE